MNNHSELYQLLAESLANFFAPMVEVALYENNELRCVFNQLTSHVSYKNMNINTKRY